MMVAENLIAFKRALYTFKENIIWSSAYNSKRSYLKAKEVSSGYAFLNFWDSGFGSRKVHL